MDAWEQFDRICRAMANPAFYPHSVRHLKRLDTHISTVFLTGRWAYKLKKPVHLGFLDFRRLEDRKIYCQREIFLNGRLSQDIYQKVVEISEDGDGQFNLAGNGLVADYAVMMKQLPDDLSLKRLLKKGAIHWTDMRKLGQRLATFYEKSERNSQIDRYGQQDVIAFNMQENFRQLQAFVGDLLDKERWEFLRQVSNSFLEHHQSLFERRVATGRIRDGHGDLRADHIYFFKGLQIIDCIEFNDRFRFGDAAVDLAFLHMDLEHLGHTKWSRIFLAAYVKKADDPELYPLIDFYATYRALVRLKITALQCQGINKTEQRVLKIEAKRYLDQAMQYAIQFSRPTLWVVCGLPGTGKSSLAKLLAETLSISLFQSDHIRKETQSVSNHNVVPFGKGLYRYGMRQRVYANLLALAQEKLKKGYSVILDATFSQRKWRDAVKLLSMDSDADLLLVNCFCKAKTIRSRLKKRVSSPGISDARFEHFPQMLADFESIVELPDDMHFRIDTDHPLRRVLAETLSKGFACKSLQVKKLL